jgi:hypothetical protein
MSEPIGKENAMKLKLAIELLGSMLTFAGGFVLTLDALMVRRRILSESGIQDLLNRWEQAGEANTFTYKGRPLNEQINLQLFLAEKTLIRSRVGLGLVTAGFLLDLVGKLVGESWLITFSGWCLAGG